MDLEVHICTEIGLQIFAFDVTGKQHGPLFGLVQVGSSPIGSTAWVGAVKLCTARNGRDHHARTFTCYCSSNN